jgi:endo-1,4-beta-mannosidase
VEKFQIGVNYWPARSAMRMWKEFDSGEVREDFARMAEFRLNPVRVFLLWEDFQPEPLRVNTKALDRLVRLCSHAADFKTGVWLTLFTGHMSGANWLPGWTLSPEGEDTFFRIITGTKVSEISSTGVVNPYENPDLRRAQKKQIGETVSAIKGHPALWGWDLGNEHSNVFRPADPEQGRSWMKEMTGEIKQHDETHPVTFGLHQQDLEENRGISPADVAQCCDLITMHAYPAYTDWARNKLDALFPLFLGELTSWLAGGKPVWISEFGISTGDDPLSVREEQAARYAGESLDLMRMHGLPGALWWCYSDYDPRLWRYAPFDTLLHERSFGAFRADGSPKEIAAILAGSGRERGKTAIARDWVDIEPEEYWRDPAQQIRRLYGRFRELSP